MQELKVVINIKGNKAVIGVQSPGCDPVFGIAEGDLLKDILMEVAGFIEIARDKWMVARQYPKSDLPQPVPAPAPAPRQATKTTAKPSSGKEKIDEKLWKPMF